MSSKHPQTVLRRPQTTIPILLLAITGLLAAACGGSTSTAQSADAGGAGSAQAPSAKKPAGIQAAKAAATIEKESFRTVLPEGWEILADDMEKMGLMTLAKKGTGGAQGVYLKFEKGFKGEPLAAIEKFASKYNGTAAATSQRNGIEWAHTRYAYNGIDQSLNITAHNGSKITFTVMGEDYDTDPGVKAVFDSLELL